MDMLDMYMYIKCFTICMITDLNLGCPQRIAHSGMSMNIYLMQYYKSKLYIGHFGSYLLDDDDRDLVLSIVHKLATNLTIPVFVYVSELLE